MEHCVDFVFQIRLRLNQINIQQHVVQNQHIMKRTYLSNIPLASAEATAKATSDRKQKPFIFPSKTWHWQKADEKGFCLSQISLELSINSCDEVFNFQGGFIL